MSKMLLVVLLLAATVYISSSMDCTKTPPKSAQFTANKTCKGSMVNKKTGVRCCCLCNGIETGKSPGPATGFYCNREEYCNNPKPKPTTAKPKPQPGATTKPPSTTAAGSTASTAGSTSTSTTGSTSTSTGSTSTTTGSTSTTTGSTSTSTTTTTTTTASG